MSERGPIYNVELIDTLPIKGNMVQAMPNRKDLELTIRRSSRTAAGYEVLLHHWRERGDALERAVRLLSVCEFTEPADLDDLDIIHRVAGGGT